MAGEPSASQRPWRVTFERRPHARRRLLCFPHAGGSPAVYRPWSQVMVPDIEVSAAQLPGRAGRFREANHTAMGPLADAAAEGLADFCGDDVVLFGHSLGGLLAYEVVLRWMDRGLPPPSMLIVSGVHAPHLPPVRTGAYALDDDAFVAALTEWNGTPPEVLAHRELLELLLPSLRADFQVYETYTPSRQEALPLPIRVLGGAQDPCADSAGLAAWRGYSTSRFTVETFPGDHFFLHDPALAIPARIREFLSE